METVGHPSQKSLDAIAFALRKVFEALGIERCAAAMACDAKTAYAYQADQVIPTRRLLALLAFARDSHNPIAQEWAHKIVTEFAIAAGVKAIDGRTLEHMNRGMDALNNGGRLHDRPQEKCPECKSLLFTERTASGVIIQRCRHCFGAGKLNA